LCSGRYILLSYLFEFRFLLLCAKSKVCVTCLCVIVYFFFEANYFFLISDLYFFFEMSDLDVTQIHVSESNLADLSSSSDDKSSVPPRKITVSHLNRKFRNLQNKCEFQQTDMLMWLKADKTESTRSERRRTFEARSHREK
jgi:hypothetical protein